MGFITPIVDKLIQKSTDLVPVIGPGLRYARTSQRVTQIANPVKATTSTMGLLLELCGGKVAKYSVLCTVWATGTAAGLVTMNPTLLALGIEAGNEVLDDFYN